MSNPFDRYDAETLIARKDGLARDLLGRLTRLGIAPDYSHEVMLSARALPADQRIAILETLVEMEAIKYTLAARRVRELEPEDGS